MLTQMPVSYNVCAVVFFSQIDIIVYMTKASAPKPMVIKTTSFFVKDLIPANKDGHSKYRVVFKLQCRYYLL